MTADPGNLDSGPETYKASPEPQQDGRGCFFYGCITAIVLAVLTLLAIGMSAYVGYRAYLQVVHQYTSPTRIKLLKVEMAEADRKALRERIDAFKKALDEAEDTEPLVLTGDELNALLAEDPDVAERVYFIIEGDKLKGQVSLPLDFLPLPGVKGRYFNGKATFVASLQDGELIVRAESAEINGQPIPEQVMSGLRNANLAEDATSQPENAKLLGKLESLQIREGKVTIKAKPKQARALDEAKPEEEPSGEPSRKPGTEPQPSGTAKTKEPQAEKPQEKETPPPAEKDEQPSGTEKAPSKTASP